MLFYAKLHVAMPGVSSMEETRLRDVEKRFEAMNHGRNFHPEPMVDQVLREKGKAPRDGHDQLQSAISTMREYMPRRTCSRPPPGFDKNDPYYHHVPKNRIPVDSVPHSRHEALRAPVPHNPGPRSMNAPVFHELEESSVEGMCVVYN